MFVWRHISIGVFIQQRIPFRLFVQVYFMNFMNFVYWDAPTELMLHYWIPLSTLNKLVFLATHFNGQHT
jgi:hypothetical protein